MVNPVYIALISLLLACYYKGRLDKSGADGFMGRLSIRNRSTSWYEKYANPLVPRHKHWYYFGIINPKYKERFPLSTTALVFLTDYWHLVQFLYLNLLFVGYAIFIGLALSISPALAFVGVKLVYAIMFNLGYEK